ncbi:uncharacterized protein TNCV_2115061 [Trichonephila clavipes]|nr:uncharacterized protein TNCV_2115061 [Trichonephila clavipes]
MGFKSGEYAGQSFRGISSLSSSSLTHNASPDKNSRTTIMVSFLDVTGIKPCPNLSPNQNALRIASGTEPTLIRKEDTTPLISCPVFVLSAPL